MSQRGLTTQQLVALLVLTTIIIIIMVFGALALRSQLEGAMIQRQRVQAREHADLTADENNLRLIVPAVQEYRRDHKGKLPKFPDALVPRYLRALPVDPANGRGYAIVVIPGSRSPYEIDDAGGLSREVVRQVYGLPSPGLRYDYKSGLGAKDYDY